MIKFALLACGVALMIVGLHGAEVPSELAEQAKAAREFCMKEIGTPQELLDRAADGDLADDDKLKCYLKCVLDQFSLIEDGAINFKAMLDIVPASIKEKGTAVVEKCRTMSTGEDLCEQAYNFQKCFYKEGREVILPTTEYYPSEKSFNNEWTKLN